MMIASSHCCIAGLMGQAPACHENRPSWKGMNHLPTIEIQGLRDSGRVSCRFVNCTSLQSSSTWSHFISFGRSAPLTSDTSRPVCRTLAKGFLEREHFRLPKEQACEITILPCSFGLNGTSESPISLHSFQEDCVLCPQGQLHATRPEPWQVL